MEFGRKRRGRPDGAFNGNNNKGFKKSKPEMDSYSSGLGSKSKPCTKFYSTSGCPFGETCHFLHYVPGGGYTAMTQAQMATPGGGGGGGGAHTSIPPFARNPMGGGPPQPMHDGPAPTVKTRVCNKFNTAEGCKFGDKCHFAHGDHELGKPILAGHDDQWGPPKAHQRPPPQHTMIPNNAGNFGASATAKISVDASLAGAIIGKGGVNSKHICGLTGVKLAIRDHESDPNLRNIELEGTFDQIKQASSMVRELIVNISAASGPVKNQHQNHQQHHHNPPPAGVVAPATKFKTKMCDNFAKGSCTFGERCRFAHGVNELQNPVA